MHTEITTRLFVLIQGIQKTESNPLLILTGILQTAHREEEWENILLSLNKPPLMWEKQESGDRDDFMETLTVTLVGRYIISKKPLRITVKGRMVQTTFRGIQKNWIIVMTFLEPVYICTYKYWKWQNEIYIYNYKFIYLYKNANNVHIYQWRAVEFWNEANFLFMNQCKFMHYS